MTDDPKFADLDSAYLQCQVAMAALDEVLTPLPDQVERMDKPVALWLMSAGARAKGLHAGIVRETLNDNPHAVFALLGAYLDLLMITMEVRRSPKYVLVIINNPETTEIGRQRKSPQALVNAAMKEVPDFKEAWSLMSDMGRHFGWAAFQTALTVEHTEDAVTVTARTGPGWNDPDAKLASLRHSAQVSRSMAGMIREIAGMGRLD